MSGKKLSHERFCPEHYEEIENYELALADNFKGWCCHHRNGEQFSREWLKKNNMYYNRKDPHEFKFIKHDEHTLLHNKINNYSKNLEMTDERKKKISATLKGRKRPKSHCKLISIGRQKNSAFYKKYGMTIDEYITANNLSLSHNAVYKRFYRGQL